jgi:FkbM family methyltransferase
LAELHNASIERIGYEAILTANERLNTAIRKTLATGGVAARRLPRSLASRPDAQLTMTLEYVLAHRMLSVRKPFFFVQLGAFDGQDHDPIYPYVRKHGWHGLLVEPQRHYFEVLKQNYEGVPGLDFRNVAVGEHRGTRTLYTVANAHANPSRWAPQMASFNRSLVVAGAGTEDIEEVLVECVPLDDLLDDTPVDHIDMLQVDVEGFDAEIIRMLDLDRHAPSIVNFEHVHLSVEDHNRALTKLVDHGYRATVQGMDTLAYRH